MNTSEYKRLLNREKKTVSFMMDIYCKDHLKIDNDLCPDCKEVKELVFPQLTKCPYQERKTACGRCGLKCYPAESKAKVMIILSYAGPRIPLHHPSLALYHLWDARKALGK